MSEETASPAGAAGTTATPRKTTAATSRRTRTSAAKAPAGASAALDPARTDPFQAAGRIWPD